MNFELIFGVAVVLCFGLAIWSNADWYERCQKMNDDWYKRVTNITMVQDKILENMQKDITGFRTTQDMIFESMQKRIDELESKLEEVESAMHPFTTVDIPPEIVDALIDARNNRGKWENGPVKSES